MSPEGSAPQNPSENTSALDTNQHPEGVRPFTTPLSEVAPKIEEQGVPEDVSAIDPLTNNVEFPRFDTNQAPEAPTENEQSISEQPLTTATPTASPIDTPVVPATQTESLKPSETTVAPEKVAEKPSRWRKWVAGIVGASVLSIGAGAVAVNATNEGNEATPEPTKPVASGLETPGATQSAETATSPETSGTPEANSESLIANLNKKATSEQVEYVIATPVTISNSPTVGEAVEALGHRWNVIANSGEIDYDAPVGSNTFTKEDENRLALMSASVFDVTSPFHTANVDSIRPRRAQIAAMLELQTSAETQVNFAATTNSDSLLEANKTYEVEVDTIWTTNRPDSQSSNVSYNDDYRSRMVLNVDAAGRVHIYEAGDIVNIGNVG